MITTGDMRDIARMIEEHPEWRTEFRRLLLTQELLEAPQRLDALTETVEALSATVNTLSQNVAALTGAVGVLQQHAEVTNRRLDSIESRLDGVESRLDKLEDTVAALVLSAEATNRRLDALETHAAETNGRLDALETHAAETNRRLDSMDGRLDSMDGRLDSMDGRLDSMDGRLDSMDGRLDGMDGRLDGMDNSIGRLADAQTGMHQSLDRFRGNYASEGAWNNRREIVKLFADINRAGRPRLKTFSDEELDDMLDDNLEAIAALKEEGDVLERFGGADLIALAEGRRTREPLYWIAAEASYTVAAGDVIRASDNAKFLRAATGKNAYGVVVGVQLDPQIEERYSERIICDLEQFLNSDRDDVVYWFELTETSAQPRPPR